MVVLYPTGNASIATPQGNYIATLENVKYIFDFIKYIFELFKPGLAIDGVMEQAISLPQVFDRFVSSS